MSTAKGLGWHADAHPMSEIDWTDEQKKVLDHDAVERPALVLAGPGIGESTTVIALAQNAADSHGSGSVRLATFTRAATHELAAKLDVDPDRSAPVTHSTRSHLD